MAIFTATALVLGSILTYLTIGAVSTLAHWTAIGGAIAVFIGLTYNMIQGGYLEFLEFESDWIEKVSAGIISAAIAGFSYRLFEAIFAVLGLGSALIVFVLVAASIIFTPRYVARFIGDVVTGIVDTVGGE